ncbi:hypothetical protein CF5_0126 [Staphylococcus phage CF5]|uniref:Phage protein n=1 Tax=Staphylococcus phage CF5 TaxID=3113739 RepID=A0AAX4J7E8_9CAUD|nr:hypothetical protein CF5_0126 [Staphylococcus phage CF5]
MVKKYMNYLDKSDGENLKKDWENIGKDLYKVFGNMKPKINFLDISNVQDKNLDNKKPMLQFQDSDGVLENICNVESLEDGLSKIKRIFEDSEYDKSKYCRVVDHYDYFWIDYGSHQCFFRVTKVKSRGLGG